ncbi:MAG: SusD/RagB family nutrient-binding outer membrane lipoprotein [Clostridium sp.]|nr:SusD/RagB family nutrient-binding outer membrane lipoprotein [Clostridium sp.]
MKLNKSIIFPAAVMLGSMAVLQGCGDKALDSYPWVIDDPNITITDPDAKPDNVELLEKELRGAIPFMINYSHEPTGTWAPHKYQYQRANNIDNYAGYWTISKGTFSFGGAIPTLYTYPNDYLGGPIDTQMFTNSKNAIRWSDEFGKPEWRAIAYIIQAYLGHELTDFYGAIPFNDWRNGKTTPPLTYEPGADVYNQIFEELDTAKAILRRQQPSADELSKIEDIVGKKTVSNGDWIRWVKFANSIQLRMAMNIVKYDAAKARERAEAAVADGVLTAADSQDIGYYQEMSDCCLYFISNTWHDLRLGASIENILKHFNNPLLGQWFDTNPYSIADRVTGIVTPAGSGIYGIRAGINFRNLNVTDRVKGYGPFSTLSGNMRYMHQDFFKRVECSFLRAEGALRGWNMGGTAQEFYEEGIRLTMSEYGIDDSEIEKYLAQTDLPAVDYVDPYQSMHNTPGRVTIGVKWDDNDSQELKLEKIITQKYINNWPQSAEAWTNFRRTGYPRLFPVYLNNMDGVDTELQIRRIPLVENGNNALDLQSLTEAIGGPQTGYTRVFWDIQTEERGEVCEENGFQYVIPKNF